MFRIITTVGTSLIINYKSLEVERDLEGHKIMDNDLKALDKLTPEEVLNGNEQTVHKLQKILDTYWIKGVAKKTEDKEIYWIEKEGYNEDCCAEIKTLLEFYREQSDDKNLVLEVDLIITDTARAALSAKLIKDNISHFNKNMKVTNIIIAKGLQTENFTKFENEGIENLFKELVDKIINDKEGKKFDKDKTIINISGGYKAIIPYMTIFAQVYGIKSIYIYEDSTSLITIPVLPIQIDWGFAEEYYPYLSDSILNRDKKKQDYLVEKGLLKWERNKYLWTSLGDFFKNVIERELHVSKTVMGFFFEYKLYEYYVENVYQNKYKFARHSELIYEDNNPRNEVEIDLILSTGDNGNGDYVAIEVKPAIRLDTSGSKGLKSFDKLKEQIEKHRDTMRDKYKYGYAKEYHLCVYTPNNRIFNQLYDDQVKNIVELSKIFENTPVKFKAFIIKANYGQMKDRGMENSNPYQQLMKDKLEYGKNFKEIKYKGE